LGSERDMINTLDDDKFAVYEPSLVRENDVGITPIGNDSRH